MYISGVRGTLFPTLMHLLYTDSAKCDTVQREVTGRVEFKRIQSTLPSPLTPGPLFVRAVSCCETRRAIMRLKTMVLLLVFTTGNYTWGQQVSICQMCGRCSTHRKFEGLTHLKGNSIAIWPWVRQPAKQCNSKTRADSKDD